MQELEIEFKNLLTTAEFNRLNKGFQITSSAYTNQINHYFDTFDFQLKQVGSALRIREKQREYTLTLKQPHQNGLLETHEPITKQQATLIIEQQSCIFGEVAKSIEELGIDITNLNYLGYLETNRAEISYKNGTLVFDHSHYFNIDDYELEYEVMDREKGEKIFRQLLSEYQIPERDTLNKIQRFFNAKNT